MKRLDHKMFVQVVELVRSRAEEFATMTLEEAGEVIGKEMGVANPNRKVLNDLFEVTGIERKAHRKPRKDAGSSKYRDLAAATVRSLQNCAIPMHVIDPELLRMAGHVEHR